MLGPQWGEQGVFNNLLFVPALSSAKSGGVNGFSRTQGPTAADLIWLMFLECGQLRFYPALLGPEGTGGKGALILSVNIQQTK